MVKTKKMKQLLSWRREERLAVFACVLAILLMLQVGMGYYQAQEIHTFIVETQRKQDDAAWSTYLSMARKITRSGVGRSSLAVFRNADLSKPPTASKGAGEELLFPPLAHDAITSPGERVVTSPFLGESSEVAWNVVSPFLPAAGEVSPYNSRTAEGEFPAFEHAVYPVFQVPNWGTMHTPEQWDRHYKEMGKADMVPLPRYDLKALTIPMDSLVESYVEEAPSEAERTETLITAKLVYSTRYYGSYDIDAGEFSGAHPGLDIKLAFGTPVNSIAGGRVQTVAKDENLGLYTIVEHHLATGEIFYSIYGHLDTVWVQEGQDVRPAQGVGTVGMSGKTTAPHLHFQVDRDDGQHPHVRFWPNGTITQQDAERYTVNPMEFIAKYGSTVQ